MANVAADPIIISSESQLRDMERHLLTRERDQPAVALAPAVAEGPPTLAPGDARAIIGVGATLYVIAEDDLLDLQDLPSPLALARGFSARIWQPELTSDSDPDDHPLVRALGTESTLEVLALKFDLSRPRVRKEIKRIEGIRAFTERQLDKAIEQMNRKRPPASLTRAGR
jgi:hypothetical protein